ncbi:MAG: peptidylprolyl isomerase [Clostridia bacterium]|nr:peptidylprolyl isomerase [Clostridia bacterium]
MNNPKIKMTIRDFGEITAELYPDKAPKTVENFLSLIESGFFSGLIFHRFISGFMIQGGGYNESFSDKDAPSIKGEFASNGFAQNDLKHTRGVLSMARTNDPNSASSQFFIMHQDAPYLDRQYAGFGKVTEGIEVVDKIAAVPTGRMGWFDDVPRVPVVIDSMVIIER